MKRIVVLILQCLSFCLWAIAQENGIAFDQNLKWEQVMTKARTENKYVFVDCYASWCVSCKKMEKEVFTKKTVGDYVNAHFISVKVQMDTSKNDNAAVKSWYQEAHQMQKQFKVHIFPTYLFFAPNGEIVHRYFTAISDTQFLKIARNALDPDKQYYTLLNNYLNGNKNYERLGYLSNEAKNFKEDSLANMIAADYLHNYTNKLNEDELLKKKYFDFIQAFYPLLSSKDKLFTIMYGKSELVNQIKGEKNFSQSIVQYVISREEVNNKLASITGKTDVQPEFWSQLNNEIKIKYNAYYADNAVLSAQINWYSKRKDWLQLIKYKIKYIDNYGLDTTGIGWALINNFAWNYVFKYCNNRDTLNKVAEWMQIVLIGHPDDYICMDTYANILFKAGRKNEAIIWEEKAIDIEKREARRKKREPDKSLKETLDKIKAGTPTWVVK